MIFFIVGIIVGAALMWLFAYLLAEHDDDDEQR